MPNLVLILLQFVHIFFASILLGSSLFMNIVLWPTLLRLKGPDAKDFYEKSLKPTSVLMGGSGVITLLTGLLRGTVYGNIHSWDALTTTYGVTFLVALVSMLGMMVHGPQIGPSLLKQVWNGGEFSPEARKRVEASHWIPLAATFILLGCMVLMHFGL